MTKEQQIDYLNKVKPFINLSAVCEDYNSKSDTPIDYNNLRAVLNGVSKTRLSEERLDSFISYLYSYLYTEIFNAYSINYILNSTKIKRIVNKHISLMIQDITMEVKNELYNK